MNGKRRRMGLKVQRIKGRRFKYDRKMIDISSLKKDERYQRPTSPNWVDDISETFVDSLSSDLIVSIRKDGPYVIDGWHHAKAMEQIGKKRAYARIYYDLTLQDEAVLFSFLNKYRKGITPVENFKAELVASDPVACDINNIITRYGLTIGDKHKYTGKIVGCIKALENVYDQLGPAGLERIVYIITTTWDNGDFRRIDSRIFRGFQYLFSRKKYSEIIDDRRLIEKLSGQSPNSILRRAANLIDESHTKSALAHADIIVRMYNTGLRSKKIPRPHSIRGDDEETTN